MFSLFRKSHEPLFYSLLLDAYKAYLCKSSAIMFGTSLTPAQIPDLDPKSNDFLQKVGELLDTTCEQKINGEEPLTYTKLKEFENNESYNKLRKVLNNLYQIRLEMIKTGKRLTIDGDNNFVLTHTRRVNIAGAQEWHIVT